MKIQNHDLKTTVCPQKKFKVCFLAISQLLLGQIQKVRYLLLIFVESEILEVKDTRGHFQFSHFQVI